MQDEFHAHSRVFHIHFEHRTYDPQFAYAQSRTANPLFVVSATRRRGAEGIAANTVNPGGAKTGLQRNFTQWQRESLNAAEAAGVFTCKTIGQGAATTLVAAVARSSSEPAATTSTTAARNTPCPTTTQPFPTIATAARNGHPAQTAHAASGQCHSRCPAYGLTSLARAAGRREPSWPPGTSRTAPHRVGKTVSEQLDASGYDRARLLGVLITHSHWDHVSGLDGLRVPVWMNPGERRYAAEDPGGKVFRAVSAGHQIREYQLSGPPYLGFASSFDVHGDGSVVVALAGGRTPGSVAVFVTVPSGQRYAFIGDLTWQLDGIRRRAERPWLLRRLADSDPGQVRQGLLRAIALNGLMQIVPAHDLSAYDGIPRLASRLAPVPAPGTTEQAP
jgi:N-acyl homoserine lactone hydrolase